MVKIRSMVFAVILIGLSYTACNVSVEQWPLRDSYIAVTDNEAAIVILDSQGKVVKRIYPLVDSMEEIHSPILLGKSEKVAFLSRNKPSAPFYIYAVDRNGKNLVAAEIPNARYLDGSPVSNELLFSSAGTGNRLTIVDFSTNPPAYHRVFNKTQIYCPAVEATVTLTQAFAGAYSPDGEKIAFITLGTYPAPIPSDPPIERVDIGIVNRDGSGYKLLTGNYKESLPFTSWVKLLWTFDGKYVLAITGRETISSIYVFQMTGKGAGVLTTRSTPYLHSYSYVTVSPTGDTLLFGTTPGEADLFVADFYNNSTNFKLAAKILGRLSNKSTYAEPDWGPGGEK